MREEQATLDTDLESRLGEYFNELGHNAYAAFNTMTDIASRPPLSPRFRRASRTAAPARPFCPFNLSTQSPLWCRDSR